MTLKELEYEFSLLPKGYKTKDVDKLNKRLIKENKDVSFLKEIILNRQEFYRTYFQVEMGKLNNYKDQMKFIEDNYLLLNDWWHVDELTQFVNILDLKYAYNKAKKYVNSKHPFLRRWGYVLFMPRLVKEKEAFDLIISLLKDDDEYNIRMSSLNILSCIDEFGYSHNYNAFSADHCKHVFTRYNEDTDVINDYGEECYQYFLIFKKYI